MQLKNQNNQNLISKVNEFAEEIKKTGKKPEQIFYEIISSGKYTPNQIEQAKRQAMSVLSLFGKK